MYILLQLLLLIQFVTADIPPQEIPPYNSIDGSNIVATSLWAMGVCSCIGMVCKHKNKLPIQIIQSEYGWDGEIYEIIPKDGEDLYQFRDNIVELKDMIESFIKKEEGDSMIEPKIRFMFGEGEIKYKENEKYYHGTDKNNMKRWIKGDGALHRFFERTDGKELKWNMGTNDHHKYCHNCAYDDENSKNRTVFNVYRCNGHEVVNL